MTTSFKLPIKKGSLIVGKWNGQHYRVERLLGEGANGKVFLVKKDWNWYALKVGLDSIDLQSEINAIKALAKGQSVHGNGYLNDVDDCTLPCGSSFSFYTMKYIKGSDIPTYLAQQGEEWFPLIGTNLLRCLAKLHAAGWIFGDLKLENIIVSEYGHVELIDYGGATPIGKSVKQFTEVYDRGYWNSGGRSAEPTYDLFSFGVLCIQVFAPKKLATLTKELIPQNRTIDQLMAIVKVVPQLQPYELWLHNVFSGHYQHGDDASKAWRKHLYKQKALKKSTKTPRWLKTFVAISLLSLAITTYLFIKIHTAILN